MTSFTIKVISLKIVHMFRVTFPDLLHLETLQNETEVFHFLIRKGEKVKVEEDTDLTLNLCETNDGQFFHDLGVLLNAVDIH